MPKLKVAIIGPEEEGNLIYKMINAVPEVEIAGLFHPGNDRPAGGSGLHNDRVPAGGLQEIARINDLDAVILAGETEELRNEVSALISPGVSLLDSKAVDLIMLLLKEKEKLLEFKKIQSELAIILNSVHEAIEVADKNGLIKYVNPAFTRITGIPEGERIGKNIFEVSPDGALATVLKTGKNIFGHRTKVGGSTSEVISNAAPIYVDGNLTGGVVVFQHLTDVMKLMDALRHSTSLIENLSEKLGQVTTSKYTFNDILGTSQELKKCIQVAERAARSNSTVLLLGESGTGKELFAHAIHHSSPRREKPFIKVNCAAIPENLLESEFFGYAKGAFTGAVKSKIGKFELANGGTIFLDEIGDMSLNLQGKLLRVLQEMEFERVGGNQTIKVDVRVIAATNRNLRDLIRQGRFREDLYYRLNVVEITIPPLRYHKEDLPMLCNNLVVKLNRKLGKKVKGLSKDAEEALYGYNWPGNVRELENVIERVMVTVDDEIITKKNLIQHVSQFKNTPERELDLISIDMMEQILIKKALTKFGNTVEGKRKAAQALNISLATLYNKLKKSRSDNL
ncbi:MAG: sigma 54-interacting transcriptional regulator [Peptococcaceae bacterium]|nr:sigma 54-interacting transcriptional regulator [Peptococcaceae bacterium]